jgi:hypothetical protein
MVILSGEKVVARIDFASFHHEPYPYQLLIWQQRIERTLQDALQQCGHAVERSTRLLRFAMDKAVVTAQIEAGCHEPEGQSPNLERMRELFCERTGDTVAQLNNPAWMNAFAFSQRMPKRFIVERAILVGDAAHVHTGAGAQGMNTGIQDALNLGWKLALTVLSAASPVLLQTYESERMPNACNVLRTTLKYQWFQLPHGSFARLVAGAFFEAVVKIRPLGNAIAKLAGMLNVNYKHSSLSRQDSRHGTRKTCAGWHVPAAPFRIGGRAAKLFDALRGTQANLLLFAGVTPSVQTINALRDMKRAVEPLASHLRVNNIFASEADAEQAGATDENTIVDGAQHLQTAFGMHDPEIIYVRPDGYIGLRTQDPIATPPEVAGPR